VFGDSLTSFAVIATLVMLFRGYIESRFPLRQDTSRAWLWALIAPELYRKCAVYRIGNSTIRRVSCEELFRSQRPRLC
jgi:hypothetical protein